MHELMVSFKNVQQLYQAYMPFINSVGIFISTEQEYHLGEQVHISYLLPDELDVQQVLGKVVWINPTGAASGRPVGIGVKFLADIDMHRSMIEKALSTELAISNLTSTI